MGFAVRETDITRALDVLVEAQVDWKDLGEKVFKCIVILFSVMKYIEGSLPQPYRFVLSAFISLLAIPLSDKTKGLVLRSKVVAKSCGN